ncbi:UDP-N-acetylglucosamine transporter [Thraustotheca clavata]|uniref:UDP-N-acetylglucosamine transporter n=1 Tax=Thraustotheca clavata TaxID=74557 RepID=A0A1V9YZ27_9STRA|nr:UDP-N-acetylglucosamine transporter [Thraustotheca clavata]
MVDLKVLSFVLLVFQNTLLGIVSKYSRSTKYNATSAVMLIELLKLVLCFIVVVWTKRGLADAIRSIRLEVLGDVEGFKKMIFLALLYAFQNTVALLSYDHVDVATYNIVYQLKIVTTAFFMVLFLKRTFNTVQWMAMVTLMIGVAICSASKSSSSNKSSSMIGVFMVVGLAVNSGIAAAYLEKVLKSHQPHETFANPIDPLWKTNIQLAAVSVAATFFGVVYAALTESHFAFFEGYNPYTFGVVLLQAFGGLIIAAVVRYSDNIVKNFGTALSLVLSCLLSNYLFSESAVPVFYVGVFLVVGSVFVYGDKRFHGTPALSKSTELPKTTNSVQINIERKNSVLQEEEEAFLNQRTR